MHLAGDDDVAGFRAAVRRLLAQGVEPDRVSWRVATAAMGDLFDAPSLDEGIDAPPTGSAAPSPRLPASFVALFERAALHADPLRHALLYRLAWRLLHERALRGDPLDADRMQAEHWARAVRRDMHKMTAFVRLRPLAAPSDDRWRVSHVAWFEPQHHIVRATAPFFARRFANMAWAILTPECSVRWNGTALAFGPGGRREDAPPQDAGERSWLVYYESIFNPARLKLAMMQKEMPRRYWKNLPEAVLIQPLVAQSAQRSGRMIEQGASDALKRRPAASIALRRVEAPAALGGLDSLPALREAIERCRACPIGAQATQSVSGEGPANARLMLVGEQPGNHEDLAGRPFVGPAGRLLDRALAQLHWPRDTLFLTNAVRHFKFELRGQRRIHKTPAQHEAAACLHWLEAEIALVRPAAAIALGATAARALLGRPVGVQAERGRWLLRDDGVPVLVTLHPAALLRLDAREFDAAFDAWLTDLRAATHLLAPSASPDAGGLSSAAETPRAG